jgi:tRNA 5-methylaminomethyl-2-thiouridine biosynthesis bifunctional protein
LAARGWQVTVLAQGSAPADGASGLPAGVTAPHVSPDDRPVSRLTRAGVAATFARARALLREGIDFAECGVLERHESGKRQTPASWQDAIENEAARPLSAPASARQCRQAGIAEEDEHAAHDHALWHARAGWLRPAALVRAMLAAPRVRFVGGAQVARIAAHAGGWQALDAAGNVLAQADQVFLAAGYGTLALLTASSSENAAAWPLHPLRGQLAFGPVPENAALPPFAVNGHGNFMGTGGPDAIWVAGATFVRDDTSVEPRPAEHAANLQRLDELLPPTAALLAPQWTDGRAQAWAGVRCTVPDRLPMAGPLPWPQAPDALPPCVLTGLGSRGLTLAVLAAEIAAAWLHGEPLPVERSLARALRASRWSEKAAKPPGAHPHRRAHPPGGPA